MNVEAIRSLSFNESDALFLMACRQWNIHRIPGWKGFFFFEHHKEEMAVGCSWALPRIACMRGCSA